MRGTVFSDPAPSPPPLSPQGRREKECALEVDLWLTPSGTARPDEVLEVLGLRDLLDAGAVLERAWLEIIDEITEATSAPLTEGKP